MLRLWSSPPVIETVDDFFEKIISAINAYLKEYKATLREEFASSNVLRRENDIRLLLAVVDDYYQLKGDDWLRAQITTILAKANFDKNDMEYFSSLSTRVTKQYPDLDQDGGAAATQRFENSLKKINEILGEITLDWTWRSAFKTKINEVVYQCKIPSKDNKEAVYAFHNQRSYLFLYTHEQDSNISIYNSLPIVNNMAFMLANLNDATNGGIFLDGKRYNAVLGQSKEEAIRLLGALGYQCTGDIRQCIGITILVSPKKIQALTKINKIIAADFYDTFDEIKNGAKCDSLGFSVCNGDLTPVKQPTGSVTATVTSLKS